VDERQRLDEVPTDRPPEEPFLLAALDEAPPPPPRRGMPRLLLVGLGLLVLLGAAVYGGDLLVSRGQVPRGTVVTGVPGAAAVPVGGMKLAAAEAALRTGFAARTGAPVRVSAGDVRTQLDPVSAGLGIDWPATLAQAGAQPLNPWTRITSFSARHEIPVITATDSARLAAAVEGLRAQTDRPAVEGALTFDGAAPVPVQPVAGQGLDPRTAVDALASGWLSGTVVALSVQPKPVTVTAGGLATAVSTVAVPAVSGPFTVTGKNGTSAVLRPKDIAAELTFAPDGAGGLTPTFDAAAATAALTPQLAGTETKPVDAAVRLSGGRPQVVPAVTGATVDWPATLKNPLAMVTSGTRSVPAVYKPKPANFTTEQATALGITDVIGEFTTGGFADASGVNIRRVAEQVQGAVVKPGDTFSLNGYTGPRGTAQGYVDAGIILNGRPSTAVGGGISQFATTLYNASYFAGMADVSHQEHSYYISRYPPAREATVFEGVIDLEFKVPTSTGVLIETIGTQSDITVRIWGTKTVNVQSITGGRDRYTEPNTIRLPAGPNCVPATGGQGFTTSDTRVITDAKTGQEISRKTRTVRYDSHPTVVCEGPSAAAPPSAATPPSAAPIPPPTSAAPAPPPSTPPATAPPG